MTATVKTSFGSSPGPCMRHEESTWWAKPLDLNFCQDTGRRYLVSANSSGPIENPPYRSHCMSVSSRSLSAGQRQRAENDRPLHQSSRWWVSFTIIIVE